MLSPFLPIFQVVTALLEGRKCVEHVPSHVVKKGVPRRQGSLRNIVREPRFRLPIHVVHGSGNDCWGADRAALEVLRVEGSKSGSAGPEGSDRPRGERCRPRGEGPREGCRPRGEGVRGGSDCGGERCRPRGEGPRERETAVEVDKSEEITPHHSYVLAILQEILSSLSHVGAHLRSA